MVTRAAKDLLRNTIRSTDYHNRLLEEDEMWRQWELERGLTMMVTDDCLKKRLRMDEYSKPIRQINRRINDSEPSTSDSTYWTRKFCEAEEQDPDRWGHSGYKELYPEEFKNVRKSRSVSLSSNSSSTPVKSKVKRKSKKHKFKKRHKRKREASESDSEDVRKEFLHQRKRKKIKSKHKKTRDKNEENHQRIKRRKVTRDEEINSHGRNSPSPDKDSSSNSENDECKQNNNKIQDYNCTNHEEVRDSEPSDNGVPETETPRETNSETESESNKPVEESSTEESNNESQSKSTSDDDAQLRQQQLQKLARFRRHFRSYSVEKEVKSSDTRDCYQTANISWNRSSWEESNLKRTSRESDRSSESPKKDWQKTRKRKRRRGRKSYANRQRNRT